MLNNKKARPSSDSFSQDLLVIGFSGGFGLVWFSDCTYFDSFSVVSRPVPLLLPLFLLSSDVGGTHFYPEMSRNSFILRRF